jgi:hypothetical protein
VLVWNIIPAITPRTCLIQMATRLKSFTRASFGEAAIGIDASRKRFAYYGHLLTPRVVNVANSGALASHNWSGSWVWISLNS